ncbi:MAG: cupin domain-containing protein [Candidatus Eremiobacteraeota bacterium]|nr:cupin domain-containing protein [Candidatus Eremiobacteraeota bacterium]
MEKVNLRQAFSTFSEPWSPKIAGEINDMHLKLVKLKGEFTWHHHEVEDELFLVIEGSMLMRFRDREVPLGPGEYIIVPHGVEHLPFAPEECHVVLLEPKSTINTGNVENEFTLKNLGQIS